MDVANLPQLVRNAERLNEVVSVLLRYGLAPWLRDVPAQWVQKLLRTSGGESISELEEPVRIRMALVELGTTFVKLGQMLSTRADLIGPDLAAELAKLQSETPPDPPEVVVGMIAQELGGSPAEIFQSFDEHAIASASIGQVHEARLRSGQSVVVKVQHAGIETKIRNDLEILVELAKIAESNSSYLAQYQPVATTKEFRQTLENELDFRIEQRSLERFRSNFADDATAHFPMPYASESSQRVLTMEKLEGISVSCRADLVASGYDLAEVARRGAELFLKMVFRHRFYHADPHPGNLMVLDGGVIGVLDGGMVGHLSDTMVEQIEDLLIAAFDRDSKRMVDAVIAIGQPPADLDKRALLRDLERFLDDYGSRSVDEIDTTAVINDFTDIIRSYQIILPSEVTLLLKMVAMLKGTATQLSPQFSLEELLEPYRIEAIRNRLSPQRLWKQLVATHRDWTHLIQSLPDDAADIIGRMRVGSFDVHLDHRNLGTIVNRLVMGILAAALFVGSTQLWSSNVAPRFHGVSVPGILGTAIAIYLGSQVIRAIKRSGDLRDRH
ncbi:ABC1 kinase family protein [Allorhodopirellula solitaria]|uniref:ABC1 atypical kinase-like domain-containing protein n=1 Tax=Allorhodopirellula solitaria TaxID=2527987 RepID=A0A5C5XYP6_9BACT|nr:AarF/ABC1/UbiB kinase family protein [Allorhodopirellula solitaria]TWT67065.1 putative protein kinase UbiB [Allorhodopirellula solitaria]